MSLISQNAMHKELAKKKRKSTKKNEIALVEEGFEDGNEMELDATKTQKRKRGRKDVDELKEIEEENEMVKLENSLFGSLYNKIKFGEDDEEEEDEEEEEPKEELDNGYPLYFTDKSANSALSVYEEDIDPGEESSDEQEKDQRKPVWVDEEEERTSVNLAHVNRLRKLRVRENESVISGSEYVKRLRAQHIKMNPGTDWARPNFHPKDYSSEDEDLENADNILKTNEDLVLNRSSKLLPGLLEFSRLTDVNIKCPAKGPVNSVQFHNNAQLLLVGSLDRTLKFFQVDGKRNEMIQSIFLEDCPVRKAAFLPDGSQAIISGRRKFAYSFDLVKAQVEKIGPLAGRDEKSLETFEISPDSKTIAFVGNEGYIMLVSTKTKELIGTLKMNGSVRAISFTNDSEKLLSTGGDGKIYHWDMRTRTCCHIGVDEGCLNGTALCASPVGNLFAAGSDSGIVNIYNGDDFLGGKSKPIKAIENLTTKVDFMKFNYDAQILAIGSRYKKNSMKLVHVPSCTVFSNWPPFYQALGYPSCVDFSPHGGFMTMGNSAGKVMLYKLHQYHQA